MNVTRERFERLLLRVDQIERRISSPWSVAGEQLFNLLEAKRELMERALEEGETPEIEAEDARLSDLWDRRHEFLWHFITPSEEELLRAEIEDINARVGEASKLDMDTSPAAIKRYVAAIKRGEEGAPTYAEIQAAVERNNQQRRKQREQQQQEGIDGWWDQVPTGRS